MKAFLLMVSIVAVGLGLCFYLPMVEKQGTWLPFVPVSEEQQDLRFMERSCNLNGPMAKLLLNRAPQAYRELRLQVETRNGQGATVKGTIQVVPYARMVFVQVRGYLPRYVYDEETLNVR
jgi:hypothetical protein